MSEFRDSPDESPHSNYGAFSDAFEERKDNIESYDITAEGDEWDISDLFDEQDFEGITDLSDAEQVRGRVYAVMGAYPGFVDANVLDGRTETRINLIAETPDEDVHIVVGESHDGETTVKATHVPLDRKTAPATETYIISDGTVYKRDLTLSTGMKYPLGSEPAITGLTRAQADEELYRLERAIGTNDKPDDTGAHKRTLELLADAEPMPVSLMTLMKVFKNRLESDQDMPDYEHPTTKQGADDFRRYVADYMNSATAEGVPLETDGHRIEIVTIQNEKEYLTISAGTQDVDCAPDTPFVRITTVGPVTQGRIDALPEDLQAQAAGLVLTLDLKYDLNDPERLFASLEEQYTDRRTGETAHKSEKVQVSCDIIEARAIRNFLRKPTIRLPRRKQR